VPVSSPEEEEKAAEGVFQALLMGQMMKPLAASMGGMGEVLINQLVTQFAEVDSAKARLS
jgi:hypothetical protein